MVAAALTLAACGSPSATKVFRAAPTTEPASTAPPTTATTTSVPATAPTTSPAGPDLTSGPATYPDNQAPLTGTVQPVYLLPVGTSGYLNVNVSNVQQYGAGGVGIYLSVTNQSTHTFDLSVADDLILDDGLPSAAAEGTVSGTPTTSGTALSDGSYALAPLQQWAGTVVIPQRSSASTITFDAGGAKATWLVG